MEIWMAASEMAPYAKTGGLADVIAALPGVLVRAGHSVSCVLPYYHSVRGQVAAKDLGLDLAVPLGERQARGRLLEAMTPEGVRLYLVRRDEYFDRSSLYGTGERDYDDNAERFIFFSKAAHQIPRLLNRRPDVYHCHDWQTALLPLLVRLDRQSTGFYSGTHTVFTIHNLAYQGVFWALDYPMTNLPPALFSTAGLEYYGNINLMKAGILFCDLLTTVSPTYAREIQTPEFGCGLHAVVASRKDRLFGILNGVDLGQWHPSFDPLIAERYCADDLSGKWRCRAQLISRSGFSADPERRIPVLGWIGRLVEQKGLDLLMPSLSGILDLPARLVMLGDGEPTYAAALGQAARSRPDRMAATFSYDNRLAHEIEAGADIFIMPSRFEPCGLNQMYSLLYGTVPVVHAVGGLADTVEPWDPSTGSGNGFPFSPFSPDAFQEALRSAVTVWRDREQWARLQDNGMRGDYGWATAAKRYLELYRGL